MGIGYRDVPIEGADKDTLGIGDYADSLAKFIQNCDSPMTIAIQGDWGSGKTSMMNLIREKIKKNVIPVWFNTWQYSQFDMGGYLSISLISSLLEEIKPEKNITDSLKKFMSAAAKGAMTIAIEKTAGETIAGQFADTNSVADLTSELRDLKHKIETAIEWRLQKEQLDRVVIFVDDLDRLPPERAIEVLEVMKTFLDIPGCIFILAVDYGIVIQGIRKKYGEMVEESKGKSFFDKIIQLPFILPVNQYDVHTFIDDLLQASPGIISRKMGKEQGIELLTNLVRDSIGFNPRSVKRLFNSYLLLIDVMEKKRNKNSADEKHKIDKKDRQRILFAVLCIQMAFDPLYDTLLHDLEIIDDDYLTLLADESKLRENKTLMSNLHKNMKSIPDMLFQKMATFCNVFYQAIQCDDILDELSDEEVRNLREILSFSSITSTVSEGRAGYEQVQNKQMHEWAEYEVYLSIERGIASNVSEKIKNNVTKHVVICRKK
ncbi:MAG TPA: P-loop NTPase fold protein [Treponemataceae bacterium]|nr:P-loop NTPase fold protein [Treponemataceae bacterium]